MGEISALLGLAQVRLNIIYVKHWLKPANKSGHFTVTWLGTIQSKNTGLSLLTRRGMSLMHGWA